MGTQADRIARLRLIRSDTIGPITYRQLLARFGSAQAALDAIPDLAARGGGRAPRLATAAEAEREMNEIAKLGARHIFLGEADYPALLAEVETAPPVRRAEHGDDGSELLLLEDRPAEQGQRGLGGARVSVGHDAPHDG